MTEYYVAPVNMSILYNVKKYQDQGWSYQIKLNFSFDHHDDFYIKDEILTEYGVYIFNSENHAKVEGKRTAKQMEEYFRDELPKMISKVMEKYEVS